VQKDESGDEMQIAVGRIKFFVLAAILLFPIITRVADKVFDPGLALIWVFLDTIYYGFANSLAPKFYIHIEGGLLQPAGIEGVVFAQLLYVSALFLIWTIWADLQRRIRR
jgi:hypothetical protein